MTCRKISVSEEISLYSNILPLVYSKYYWSSNTVSVISETDKPVAK